MPRTVAAYTLRLAWRLQDLNLPSRLAHLQSVITSLLEDSHITEWEEINKLRVQAMLMAESQCRKLRLGHVPWSPTLQQTIDTVSYWQLMEKRALTRKISSKLLAHLCTAAKITSKDNTLDSIRQHLRAACSNYWQAKHQADELCGTWLENLAASRAVTFGGRAEQHLLQLHKRELERQESQACRRALGRCRNLRVETVVAPNADGQWQECATKAESEAACLTENLRRFQQAAHTPFLCPPLSTLVDPLGINQYAEAICDGSFPLTDTYSSATARVLQALRQPPSARQQPIKLTLTKDE